MPLKKFTKRNHVSLPAPTFLRILRAARNWYTLEEAGAIITRTGKRKPYDMRLLRAILKAERASRAAL